MVWQVQLILAVVEVVEVEVKIVQLFHQVEMVALVVQVW
jgi:hypothetical protein